MHAYIHTYIHTYIRIHTYIHTYIYVHIGLYACNLYTYIYIGVFGHKLIDDFSLEPEKQYRVLFEILRGALLRNRSGHVLQQVRASAPSTPVASSHTSAATATAADTAETQRTEKMLQICKTFRILEVRRKVCATVQIMTRLLVQKYNY
jgi:hypothetical protein